MRSPPPPCWPFVMDDDNEFSEWLDMQDERASTGTKQTKAKTGTLVIQTRRQHLVPGPCYARHHGECRVAVNTIE